MTTLSHVAAGFLIGHAFVSLGILPHHTAAPYLASILLANAPDIDALLAPQRLYNHHNNFKHASHYPVNWLCIICVSAVIGIIVPIRNFWPYLLLASANMLGHFLLDTFSIYGGIPWFGPWNNKKYSFVHALPKLPTNNKDWIGWYTKHWIIYLETALWVVAMIVFMEGRKHHVGPIVSPTWSNWRLWNRAVRDHLRYRMRSG